MRPAETPTRLGAPDPWARLAGLGAALRAASGRMRELPIYNAALRVEAVGFRLWNGNLCGVMVTPWFMSIVVLPGAVGAWGDRGPGDKVVWRLPSGQYEFIVGGGEGAGPYLACSLFSPMLAFPDHDTARMAAEAAAEAVFRADDGAATAGGERPVRARRALLTGALIGGAAR